MSNIEVLVRDLTPLPLTATEYLVTWHGAKWREVPAPETPAQKPQVGAYAHLTHTVRLTAAELTERVWEALDVPRGREGIQIKAGLSVEQVQRGLRRLRDANRITQTWMTGKGWHGLSERVMYQRCIK